MTIFFIYFSECSINLTGEVLGYLPVVHVVDECIIAGFLARSIGFCVWILVTISFFFSQCTLNVMVGFGAIPGGLCGR